MESNNQQQKRISFNNVLNFKLFSFSSYTHPPIHGPHHLHAVLSYQLGIYFHFGILNHPIFALDSLEIHFASWRKTTKKKKRFP